RDGQPPPGLRPGPATTVGTAEGQAELLQTYLETVIVPTATAAVVVDWLAGQAEASVPAPAAMTSCLAPVLDDAGRAGYVERVTALGPSELFAVVTEPAPGRPWALTCLMLNSGMLGHAGPHRFHTELARRLAADGVRSVRLDFTGLGESPPAAVPESAPRPAFAPRFLSDLDEAVRALGSADDAPLVTLGLCSGAYHALEAACRHRLAGVVAIHPGYGYGEILVRPGNAEPTRRVGRVLTDRRWVRAAKRTWLGRAVAWRMPGPGWWLLDLTRLQPDLARAIAEARRHVPGIVAFVEEGIVGRPEMWTLLHRRRPPAAIEVDGADHSLWDASARLDVLERARIAVLGFRPLGAPAPDGRAAVS
ncbi:MAG TPA: hypothetical protein VKV25_05700, partial [Acidimicrobiales bacterium]|nr:hypothetical protein [Acidimicrobiales bacterium]